MGADTTDIANSSIYIVGPLNLQNEFLSYVINKETGAKCSIFDSKLDSSSSEQQIDIDDHNKSKLILIDTEDQDFEEIIKKTVFSGAFSHGLIALFNLNEGARLERLALVNNIRGFFYKDDHLEIFFKGIRAIFHGEIWVSRNALIKCVFDGFDEKKAAIKEKTALTSREIEILTLVSMGSTNEEIANKMCISTNTVKKHLYNIFKKINVSNRLQAALWATANL
jgi:LuxR family transcriptional regulator of csgAB operon